MENLKKLGTSILVIVAGVLVANLVQARINKAKLSAPSTK
jgi:hypothetical protein